MFATRVRTTSIVSFPRYTGVSHAPSPNAPARVPLPLLPHPNQTPPPPHPARPPLAPPPKGYTRTLHAAPAAYPRDIKEATVGGLSRESHPYRNAEPAKGESKEERNARLASERDECVRVRRSATEWDLETAKSTPHPSLWVSAERWRRDTPVEGGVTMVCMHACGLNKEHWHPTMQSLLARDPTSPGSEYGTGSPLSKPTNVVVNEVWFLDDTNHGVSIDLNAGRLSAPLTWLDTGKEVVNFVKHILPGIQAAESAPWQLEWKAAQKSRDPIIGVGHSYGASGVVQGVHAHPGLFSALFLVEPMVPFKLINDPAKGYPLTMGALKRRADWPSREAAKSVRDNGFFKTWDDDAFALWLSHHLVPVDPNNPDGPVTLATPAWAEAATFSEPYAPQRGWDKLPDLEMPVGFLMAGDEFWMGGEQVANEMVWRPKRARNERIMDASHLIIQEKPKETADALWRFLTTLNAGDWDKQA